MRQLNKVIREKIRYCQRYDQPADVEKVYLLVKKDATVLMGQTLEPLADQQLRIKIQHALKSTEVTLDNVAKVEAELLEEERQPELDLGDIEEFRGLRPQYAYIEPLPTPHVAYFVYSRGLKYHRDSAVEVLRDGIKGDTRQLNLLVSGNEFADALMATYGDLPLEDLIRLWRKNQARGGAGA